MVRLRDFIWKGTKILTLIFQAKYYLVGPTILIMVIYSILSKTGRPNALFPPLQSYHFTELAIFHTSCVPGMETVLNYTSLYQ